MEFTAAQPEVTDRSESVQVPPLSIQQVPMKAGVHSQPLSAGQQLHSAGWSHH